MLRKTKVGTKTAQTAGNQASNSCSCAVCTELEPAERPRYFAGQLLTEAELNNDQAYTLAKNRLHNRFLHGWGVVCGLQVTCDACDGYVDVHSGYALDPCGNDIIVPADVSVPLVDMINKCKQARRKKPARCDPISRTSSSNCNDAEEHWCLTIRYVEQEARPMAALRNSSGSTSNCGCGKSNKTSGCACSNQSTTTQAQSVATVNSANGACEPTRIYETYEFDVVEEPDGCQHDLPKVGLLGGVRGVRAEGFAAKGSAAPLLIALGQILAQTNLDGTLLGNVRDCLTSMTGFLSTRLNANTIVSLTPALSLNKANSGNQPLSVPAANQYQALCKLYNAVRDLYLDNPMNVRCSAVSMIEKLTCPAPGVQETSDQYAVRAAGTVYNLLALIVQYALDCVCFNLLPPCGASACDERIILACVTLINGQIQSICNFGCRRYAGSFPAMSYWLSAVPVIPMLNEIVSMLCCADWLQLLGKKEAVAEAAAAPHLDAALHGAAANAAPAAANIDTSIFTNNLVDLLDALDPDGSLRANVLSNNLSVPRAAIQTLSQRLKDASFGDVFTRLRAQPAQPAVDLSQYAQKSVNVTRAGLGDSGVKLVERTLPDAAAAAGLRTMLSAANSGDTVVAYRVGDTVVGFGPYDAEQQLIDKQAEIDALKTDMAGLRAEWNAFNKTPPARKAAGRKG
jgi:hypothetical protein